MPCWAWLDLSCSLFLLLEYRFGSEYAFEPTSKHPHFPCFGSCALRYMNWTCSGCNYIQDALEGCMGCWAAANRCLVPGQKKACSEYMALPQPKVYVLCMASTQQQFAVWVWSHQVMLFAVDSIPWICLTVVKKCNKRCCPFLPLLPLNSCKEGMWARLNEVLWVPDPARRSPSGSY